VYGLKDVNCAMAIYFNHDFEKPIKDKNQKYYTKGGDVAVYSYFKPIYDISKFADLPIFMPYDELDLDPGTYKVKMDVDINYDDGTRIQHLRYHDFDFKQPPSGGPNVSNTSKNNSTTVAKSGMTKKDVLTNVTNIVSEVLNVKPESVKVNSSFMKDLNATYVDVGMLFMEIEDKFGVKISNAEQAEITNTQQLYDYLVKKLKINK
jgi:acyl carrier protein